MMKKSKKAIRLKNMARGAIGMLWGPGIKYKKWMYETMLKPILAFGSIV